MNLFQKQLKRNVLEKEFYGYHSKNNINTKEEALKYLEKITNYLSKYIYKSDDNYIINLHEDLKVNSRKKFLYDEVIDILNGRKEEKDPIYFVLGSLEEFMCQNFINPHLSGQELIICRTKNDNYIRDGYICLEEKNNIMEMIAVIKDGVKNIE